MTDFPDARTIALATPPLGRDKLEAFLEYQRALLADVGPLALAETRARAASSLAPSDLGPIGAMCADFAGHASNQRFLTEKLDETRALLERGSTPKLQERMAKLTEAVEGRAWQQQLASRYSSETLELLLEHEDELVRLHQALQQRIRKA